MYSHESHDFIEPRIIQREIELFFREIDYIDPLTNENQDINDTMDSQVSIIKEPFLLRDADAQSNESHITNSSSPEIESIYMSLHNKFSFIINELITNSTKSQFYLSGFDDKNLTMHKHLTQIETRYQDWKLKMLPNTYFLQKLREHLNYLETEYETYMPPPGWTIHWDSNNNKYYYYNTLTQQTQWEFPALCYPTDCQRGEPEFVEDIKTNEEKIPTNCIPPLENENTILLEQDIYETKDTRLDVEYKLDVTNKLKDNPFTNHKRKLRNRHIQLNRKTSTLFKKWKEIKDIEND